MLKKMMVVLFILSSVSIFASGREGKRKRRGGGECRKLKMSLCGEHKGNREAMRACIKENKDSIPEKCRKRRGRGKRRSEGN